MRLIITAVIGSFIMDSTAALAQGTARPLVPPSVSASTPSAPNSSLSPNLTQPSLLQQPFRRATPPPTAQTAPAPIDQQKMQGYRNDLISRQRAFESQGLGVGSVQYRDVQQQLNQVNNGH